MVNSLMQVCLTQLVQNKVSEAVGFMLLGGVSQ